jgi:hypothetical protein
VPQKKKKRLNWVWWHIPVIPALWRLKQEDCEFKEHLGLYDKFKVSLGYIGRPCFKQISKQKLTIE